MVHSPGSVAVTAAWALRCLRWAYCVFIAWISVKTFRDAKIAGDIHPQLAAGVELAAIAAFAIPRFELPACAVLLMIYAIVAVVTGMNGEMPIRFLFYGVVAAYIVFTHRLLRVRGAPSSAAAARTGQGPLGAG